MDLSSQYQYVPRLLGASTCDVHYEDPSCDYYDLILVKFEAGDKIQLLPFHLRIPDYSRGGFSTTTNYYLKENHKYHASPYVLIYTHNNHNSRTFLYQDMRDLSVHTFASQDEIKTLLLNYLLDFQ